ncbi:unnamed protein product [Paramecium sonneborni]|uniref:NACHT domain-containing protein n=1 Tax=Paramecium sonneborni TaxID=65129 RepID=A0A8S1RD81_9CILI|nr:unnamed protein product [Paramecium sonneborni]
MLEDETLVSIITSLQNIHNWNNKLNQKNRKSLRGGGCGSSIEEKNIDSIINRDQNLLISSSKPPNFISELNDCLNLLIEAAKLFGDTSQKNSILMKIQWFNHNREHLNYLCIDRRETTKNYELIQQKFESLLTILTSYLRSSGFICYQILQICNELLRILYAFQLENPKRCFDISVQQDYLEKISEFNTQLDIEQANVWKTGIEFEITIMKIMIMNSKTNSTEGTDLLINFFKEAAKSIVSFSPTDSLLQTIIDGGKYLLKRGIEKKLYPKEVYQTYYLFQLMKWSIIRQLKSKYSVYEQIQQLKNIFQQYILLSENWVLHFSWIQMITDIISYRPIINKTTLFKKFPDQQLKLWNSLIENNLIHCVSYNKIEAVMSLFQDSQHQIHDVDLSNLLENYSKKKFVLFSQFLLRGDITQNVNNWDYYKKFAFKNQKDKTQEDYEHILANQEQEVLKKLINNIKSEKDEIIQIHSRILQSFSNYFQEPSQTFIKIFQDDNQFSIQQFLETYKKLILQTNYFQEISKFEAAKLKLLNPYFDKFKMTVEFSNNKLLIKLQNLQKQIDSFVKQQLNEFINILLNYFLDAIKFASSAQVFNQYLETQQQQDVNKIKKQFEILNFQAIFTTFENQLDQFIINLNTFKEDFIKFIQQKANPDIMAIKIPNQNIFDIIEYSISGGWIKQIVKKLLDEQSNKFLLFKSQFTGQEDIYQNFIDCRFNIFIIKFLMQFYRIQQNNIYTFNQQMQNYISNDEQPEELDEQTLQKIIENILIQQKQKLNALLNQMKQLPDEQSIKIGCKNLLAQIKSDFQLIKDESKQYRNQELIHDILKFFADSQYIIFQVQDEADQVFKLDELLIKYENKFNEINIRKDNINEKTTQGESNQINKFQTPFLNYDNKNLQQILKQCNKYFKGYQQLLCFELDLIEQQKIVWNQKLKQVQTAQDQLNQVQNINLQIQNINSKIGNFFNSKVKSQIEYLIRSLADQNKQKIEYFVIDLKLTDFLSFFYQLSHSEYAKDLKADKVNDSIWLSIKDTYKATKNKLVELLDFKPDYKVREGLAYNLIRLQYSIQEQQINQFSCKYVQHMWVFEKDQRVRNLLKNKELVEIQKQLFAQDFDNFSSSIKDELKERLQKLENLQQQIKLEGNQQKREQIQQQLKETYEELDTSLDNISELSEAIDISLVFLKDISRDVKQIKTQIDNLQESVNQLGEDIRKLRGKNYKELLEMRKQKLLLQSKLTEVDSVYIQLETIEYNPFTGKNILFENKLSTYLMMNQWDDPKGEVNEFIWEEELQKNEGQNDQQDQNDQQEKPKKKELKDVLLISGFAGSGKSKAARKIEEFLWQQQGTHSKWIPIFVSLPTLKNPKYNLFEQALETENYQFDKYQIRELKEAIQNKQEKIILILDSYDEMKQDCIQQNLIKTNKLFQDLSIDKSNRQMKVIITTRKEILNTVGYQTWFYGDSIQTLKEVQLQNFNEEQQTEYLNQYVELSIKRKIKEVYEFVKSISGQSFDLEEFLTIWNLVSQQAKNSIKKSEISKQDGIFQNKEEELIIQKIKTHKILEVLKDEQTTALQKELIALWNAQQFKKSIESVKIQDLLTTPFMLEIVVQVLPNMTKMYKGSTLIKDIFAQNFMKLKKQERVSKFLREFYQKELQISNQNKQQNLISIEDEQISAKQINEEQEQSKIEKAKLEEIIDKFDKENFFQKYSIVSSLNKIDDCIVFDGYSVKLNPDDIKLVIMSLKLKKFTIFEFYESFISFYHEQQIQKQRELGKISNYDNFAFDISQFSYSLAIDMSLRELSQVAYKPQGKLQLESNYKIKQTIDDWLKQYFDIEDEYKKLIRSCILLSAKGSTYSFTHKSIQEFYVAKYIFDLLISLNDFNLNSSEVENQDLKKNQQILINSVFNNPDFNISTDNFRNVINFVKEKLISDETITQKLIDIVKLSKSKTCCRSASNSIYLLRQMNVYLGGQNFNEIQLDNTNISGLSFFDCDLSYSKFNNVEINSCNLNFADLSNTQWDIVCKEMAFLKGHKERILEIRFSPNSQYIASAGMENIIKLWDAKTYKCIANLEGHTAQINTLSFSSKSQFLFSGSNDCTIRKWDIRNQKTEIKSQIIQKFKDQILKLQISKDSQKLYVQEKKGCFQILNLQQNDLTIIDDLVFQLEKPSMQLFALNPIEPIVAILYETNVIEFINYLTKTEVRSYAIIDSVDDPVRRMIFSQDGKYFAISRKNSAQVWDITENTNEILRQFSFPNIILKQIYFDSSGKYLIFTTDLFLFQREIINKKIQNQEQKEICFEIQISTDGRLTAIVQEKKIIIKEFLTDYIIRTLPFNFQPGQIRFSNDNSKLAFFLKENDIIMHFQILGVNKFEIIYDLPWNKHQWKDLILSRNFEKFIINFSILENQVNQFEGSLIIEKIQKDPKNRQYNLNMEKFCIKANSWIIAYTNSQANSIAIFDLDKSELIHEPLQNEKKEILSFQFSPIKNQIAVGYKGEFLIWNLDQKKCFVEKRIILENLDILNLKYSTNGSKIGFIFTDSFQIYDLDRESLILFEEKFKPKTVAFSLDDKVIGFIDDNQQVIIQNQNNEIKKLEFDNQLQLKFNQDQKSIIIGGNNKLILLDLTTLQFKIEQLTFIKFEYITFSHTLNLIALHKDRILELWMLQDHKFKYLGSQLYDQAIKQIDFVNEDQNIIILKQDLELVIYDLKQIQFNYIFEGNFQCGAFSTFDQIALAQDKQIKLFNSQTQKQDSLEVEKIQYLEFFQSKQNLLLSISNHEIIIWDFILNIQIKNVQILKQTQSKLCLNEELIITQDQNIIMIWDISDIENIQLRGLHENIYSFSINEGQKLAVGIKDGQEIKIQDLFNIQFGLTMNMKQEILKLVINDVQQFYIFLTDKDRLYIYQENKKKIIELHNYVSQFAYYQEKNYIAIIQGKKILLTELLNDKLNIINTFDFLRNLNPNDLPTFSNDGDYLLIYQSANLICLLSTTSSKKQICKVLHFSEATNSNVPKKVQVYTNQEISNNQLLLALMNSNSFKLIDVEKVNKPFLIEADSLLQFELSLDEEIVCLGLKQVIIIQYTNVFNIQMPKILFHLNHQKFFKAVSYDTFVYLNKKNRVNLFSASDQSHTKIDIPIDKIVGIDYLQYKDRLAISTEMNKIIFFDLKEKKIVGFLKAQQKQINSVAESPDGSAFASASDDLLIKLWNIKQNQSSEVMEAHQYSISALAISQDGQIVASGNLKGVEEEVPIFLWDLTNKKLIKKLQRHQDSVNCIEISFCQQLLFSASIDGTIIVWNIEYPQVAKMLYCIDEFNYSINSLIITQTTQAFVALCNLDNIQKLSIESIKKQKETSTTIKIKNLLTSEDFILQNYSFQTVDKFIYVSEKSRLVMLNIETKNQETFKKEYVTQFITSKDNSLILAQTGYGLIFSLKKNTKNQWIKQDLLLFSNQTFFMLTPNNKFLFQMLDIKQSGQDIIHTKILIHDFNKLNSYFGDLVQSHIFREFENRVCKLMKDMLISIQNTEIQIEIIKEKKILKKIQGCSNPKSIQVSEDRKYLAYNNELEQKIIIWEMDDPNKIIQLGLTNENLIMFQFSSNDSNKIYALYLSGILRNWNVATQSSLLIEISFGLKQYKYFYFSSNLKYLICQNEAKKIDVFEIANSNKYFEISVHDIQRTAFSKNEEQFALAIVQEEDFIILKNVKVQSQINWINVKFINSHISFTNNDQELICCSGKSIYLWRINESLQHVLIGFWQINTYGFEQVCYDCQKQTIIIQNFSGIEEYKLIQSVQALSQEVFENLNNQKSVCFSPDSKYFIHLNPYLRIYQVDNLKMLIENKDFEGQSIQFQQNEILVIAHNQELQFLNITDINKIVEIKKINYLNQIFDFTLSQNYSLIQFKNNNQDQEKELDQAILNKVYLNDCTLLAIFYTNRKPQFSEDGKYLALNRSNKIQIIQIQNLQKLKLEQTLFLDKKCNYGQIFYHPDGELIFLFTNQSISILDSHTLKIIKQQVIDFEVKEVQISMNWKYFALMGSNFFVKIFLYLNQEEITFQQPINQNQNPINCIALSPKGDFLLTGWQNQENFTNLISLWKLEEGKELCSNDQITDQVKILKFCPNGINFVAGLSDGSVNLYSIDLRQLRQKQQDQYNICCYQTFAKQSLLLAQECNLTQATIQSEEKSLIELFCQKGAIKTQLKENLKQKLQDYKSLIISYIYLFSVQLIKQNISKLFYYNFYNLFFDLNQEFQPRIFNQTKNYYKITY